MPPSLDEVPERVRRGDAEAFRLVVDATSRDLVRLAARMLADVQRAEDVVQESYVKAYQAMVNGTFDRRSSVETWLYRIVTNSAIDELRRRRPLADAAPEVASADDRGDARLALREVERWMRELPAEQRAVLVLSAFEERSNREIAEILECSEGSVEQRLVRARQALRKRAVVP